MKKWLQNLGRFLKAILLAISRRLAWVNTYLLMSISFFLIVLPIGLIRRLFWKPVTGWKKVEQLTRENYEKQY